MKHLNCDGLITFPLGMEFFILFEKEWLIAFNSGFNEIMKVDAGTNPPAIQLIK